MVVLARLPAEPARHRMALWRELRRSGAIPLGQAVWAVPDLPAVRPLLERLSDLIEAANGTLLLLAAKGLTDGDVARLEQLYSAAREEEWAECNADCGKYLAELDREGQLGKQHTRRAPGRGAASIGYAAGIASCGAGSARDSRNDRVSRGLRLCEGRFEMYADHAYGALSSPKG